MAIQSDTLSMYHHRSTFQLNNANFPYVHVEVHADR